MTPSSSDTKSEKLYLNPEFTVEEWDMIVDALRAYDHHSGYRELLDKIMYVRAMEVALPMYENLYSTRASLWLPDHTVRYP